MQYRSNGSWTQGIPKIRRDGEWVTLGSTGGTGGGAPDDGGVGDVPDGGFGWDQTFTDTSWVSDAGDDLNVEVVTSTASTGPGSINEALDNAAGQPTVIVFEVGGVIELGGSEDLRIRSSETWIAGQTAPDPGISITGGMLRVHEPRVIVSHVSVLPGDGTSGESDGMVFDADDVMFDHCSAMWGTDENVGAPNAVRRCSFINSICAEALYDSIHPEGQHSRGLLINDAGSTDLAVMGCLFAHNNRRHPMTRGDMVIANNYTYNFGEQLVHFDGSGSPDITAAGLLFEDGPDSHSGEAVFIYGADVYAQDVATDPDGRPLTDGQTDLVDSPTVVPPGLDLEQDIVPSSEVKDFVLQRAGPRPARRPPVEADLINERLNGDHGLVDGQNDVGGYPNGDQTTRTLQVPDTGLLDWLREHTRRVEVGA